MLSPGREPGAGVAAVVVNYNARDHLLACVSSLRAERVGCLVVVDNGSVDGSKEVLCERFPDVRWEPSGANLGYGRAANAGAAMSNLPWLLVCNADVVLRPGTVATLVDYLQDHPGVALVGPRVVDVRGVLYPSARLFPDLVEAFGHGLLGQVWKANPYSRRYKMESWDHAEAAAVDWVSGACFVARRSAWEQVAGFDRGYFMYMEDVDLCWRLGRAGWSVAYQPAAQVTHVQGVSTSQHPYRMISAHHAALWRFAWRTTPARRRWLLPLVLAGISSRLVVLLVAKAVARSSQEGRAAPSGAAG